MKTLLLTLVLAVSANAYSAPKASSQLDDLIKGEMAAVKTYDSALEQVKDPKEVKKLKEIREDHVKAVEKLKTYGSVDEMNIKSPGVWGPFAAAYEGGAKLLGNKAAIQALRDGEEHGVKEYKEALNDENLKPELKQTIKTQFLPNQEEHIKTLSEQIGREGSKKM